MITAPIAIIGAGPIGIELAVALRRLGMDYIHLEAKQVGATMAWWPPHTRWFSSNDRIAIAGVPLQTADQSKCAREEYLNYLRMIVLQFGLKINTYEPVVSIERERERFVITTPPAGGDRRYVVENVVLATGGISVPRRLNVPGEDLPHVSHYMAEPHAYFRQRVLVVGGKNSAVEAALRLHAVGAHVTFSYRRMEIDKYTIKYWLYPELKALINSGEIAAHFGTVVRRIEPGRVILAGCDPRTLAVNGQSEFELPADFVLLMVGYRADMALARMAGVELIGPNEVPHFDPQTMQTNVKGVYLAGTIAGGTQEEFQVFLENCHIHVDRIVAALTGAAPPKKGVPEAVVAMPEA